MIITLVWKLPDLYIEISNARFNINGHLKQYKENNKIQITRNLHKDSR